MKGKINKMPKRYKNMSKDILGEANFMEMDIRWIDL